MLQLQQSHRLALPGYIIECTMEFLTVKQQGRTRAVSRLMQSVVSVVLMEHLMRATAVCGNEEGLLPVAKSGCATLVVIATGRVVEHFPSAESLLSWSGGHAELYTQVRLRFPSAAIGISTRLLGTSPFPFASDDHPAMTTCALFPASSSNNVRTIESVTFIGPPDTKVFALCSCPSMLCLEATAAVNHPLATSVVPLSSIQPADKLEWSAFAQVSPLALVLANLSCEVTPIGYQPSSTSNNKSFFNVNLSGLPTLVSMNRFFARCSLLEYVSLSNMQCLETICDDTFTGCKWLSYVTLSDMPSLRTFGNAFSECPSLDSIVVRNLPSLTGLLRLLPAADRFHFTGFNGCFQLSRVDLCDLPLITTIGDSFCSCGSITSISLQNMPKLEFGKTVNDPFPFSSSSLTTIVLKNLPNVHHINAHAFHLAQPPTIHIWSPQPNTCPASREGCKKIARVELSDLRALREIGECAFSGCTSLRYFPFKKIPSLESIGDDAFAGCTKLQGADLTKNSSLKTIGARAFKGCETLSYLDVSNLPRLASIGDSAFNGCIALKAVNIPGVTALCTIGASVFSGCVALKKVVLLDLPCLVSIGDNAFNGCLNLLSVELSRLPTLSEIGKGAIANDEFVGSGLPILRKVGAYGNSAASCLETANLETIEDSIFSGCLQLSTVTLCGLMSLRTFGKAFRGCASLVSVTLKNAPCLTAIADEAFKGCTSLATVRLCGLSSLSSIGANAFIGCSCLVSVSLENMMCLESIGASAFSGCVKLSSAFLSGGSCNRASGSADTSDVPPGLTLVGLPRLESIGAGAFNGCASLTSLNSDCMSPSVSIDTSAFVGCPVNLSLFMGAQPLHMKGKKMKLWTKKKRGIRIVSAFVKRMCRPLANPGCFFVHFSWQL